MRPRMFNLPIICFRVYSLYMRKRGKSDTFGVVIIKRG